MDEWGPKWETSNTPEAWGYLQTNRTSSISLHHSSKFLINQLAHRNKKEHF